MEEIVKNIRDYCIANSNPELVKKYSRYFKEGYDAYGLNSEQIQTKMASLLSEYKLSAKQVLELGNILFQSGKYEEGTFAIVLLQKLKKELQSETLNGIGKWYENGINNWAHNDVICSELISPLLIKGIASVDDLSAWRSSTFCFKRRAVPVSLIKLAKTSKNIPELLAFIEPMMKDDERVVHQGLGWFLREAWKIDPEPVEAFLLKWKDISARLIFQYATEKMTKENKEHFRKSK